MPRIHPPINHVVRHPVLPHAPTAPSSPMQGAAAATSLRSLGQGSPAQEGGVCAYVCSLLRSFVDWIRALFCRTEVEAVSQALSPAALRASALERGKEHLALDRLQCAQHPIVKGCVAFQCDNRVIGTYCANIDNNDGLNFLKAAQERWRQVLEGLSDVQLEKGFCNIALVLVEEIPQPQGGSTQKLHFSHGGWPISDPSFRMEGNTGGELGKLDILRLIQARLAPCPEDREACVALAKFLVPELYSSG